jgi:hypothetical protein
MSISTTPSAYAEEPGVKAEPRLLFTLLSKEK